ncbi:MAG: N-acetyltransferase family protein [Flavobacteriaceae bacterium]|nr:N-acetyltransferase [Flavobacteriaceae bacterium]
MNLTFRTFNKQDWTSVSKIYAEGIATGIATFETKVPSISAWDEKFLKQCRLIAESDKKVVGFAVLSQVSKREVYKGVAEVTIYIAKNQRGKGVGKQLLDALVNESENNGFWTLQAGIFAENNASIQLHKQCGFRIVGVREKIGKLNDTWHDNVLMERRSKKIN